MREQFVEDESFGPKHPDLAMGVTERARIFEQIMFRHTCTSDFDVTRYDAPSSTTLQGKYADAAPLYKRCQEIQEKVLGSDNASFAATLHSRAEVLQAQVSQWKMIAVACCSRTPVAVRFFY